MSAPNPTDWMWAQACDLLAQAERMHRRFFRLTASERMQVSWEPPVDVFEDEREFVVVVALPGVPADRVEVSSEPGVLVIRAQCALPFVGLPHAVRQLEIPYGYFERRVALPGVPLEAVAHELIHGCLTLRLRKTG